MINEISSRLPPLQDFFFGPRVLEAIFFTVLLIFVMKKFSGVRLHKRPLLHQLFLSVIAGWTVYMWMDAFIFTFGAISFDPNIPIFREGYDPNYPSLMIANILRDIAIIGVLVEIWGLLFMVYAIRDGENKTRQIVKKPSTIAMVLLISAFVVINDDISVEVTPDRVLIEAQGSISGIFTLVIPIIIYFIAYGKLRRVMGVIKQEHKDNNILFIKQLEYFEWAVFLKGFSYAFLIIVNLLNQFIDLASIFGSYNMAYAVVSIIKHILWIVSPLLLYVSINLSKKIADQTVLTAEQ